jgi:hypothetical protein
MDRFTEVPPSRATSQPEIGERADEDRARNAGTSRYEAAVPHPGGGHADWLRSFVRMTLVRLNPLLNVIALTIK